MTNRLLIVVLWTGLALLGRQTVFAQTVLKTEPIAVNETRARAILCEGSIRFELPLTGPATAGEYVIGGLLSPKSC